MGIVRLMQDALEEAKTLSNSHHSLRIQKALAGLKANYGKLLIQSIYKQALDLGWEAEQLSGNGVLPSDRSLLQGLNYGDRIVLVDEEAIAIQKISGQIHIRKKKPWLKLSSHVEEKIKNMSKN